MIVDHYLKGDTLVAVLHGELDHHQAAAAGPQLDRLMQSSGAQHLCVDLSHVAFMDSSGIGVLLGRYRRLHRQGGRVTLIHPTAAVDRMLSLSGIESIIPIQRGGLES